MVLMAPETIIISMRMFLNLGEISSIDLLF